MVNINIKLTNKWLYTLIAIGVLFALGIGVYAYNSQQAPAVFGHTIDEIEVIQPDGSIVSLEQYIENKVNVGGNFVCDTTPIYNSMTLVEANGETGIKYNDASAKFNAGVKSIPGSCFTDAGCTIKQEIYDSKGLKLIRQYGFLQDTSSNKWWSSYRTSSTYINGDTSSADVIPAYGGDYALYLRDDYYKSGTGYTQETSPLNWTFIDRTGSYGMKVYICAETSAD